MALQSDKEIIQLQRRLKDLADKSFRQNIYTFSSFLGLAELEIYYRMEKELFFAHPALFGGDEEAERKMVRFGSPEEFGYEETYPITCLHVKPLLTKFADKLSHRDFLGALMNLGMERGCIGDIRVGEKEGFLYCQSSMAEYICDNLTQIKHTHVKCGIVEKVGRTGADEPEERDVLVSSLRLDGCIARLYQISRNDSLTLFQDGRVYVDGRLVENNSRALKDGETVNVRGYGKFIYKGLKYETKKGKLCLELLVYR
ncbi:MAG: YlmH/Sll1252 family protein [Lachnospiraceae bacterium]